METYRIFLASSFQLSDERNAFIELFDSLNTEFVKKNVYLELVIWEKLDAAVSRDKKQNDYNRALQKCDILVLIFWGELGIFTQEEYILALNLMRKEGRPRIYIFEKTGEITFQTKAENKENLQALRTELAAADKMHWPWTFNDKSEMLRKFSDDLRRLFEDPENIHFTYGKKAELLTLGKAENPNLLIGREEELLAINDRFRRPGKFLMINADGGIGKTTLAARFASDSIYRYKRYAWLYCETGIIDAIKGLAPRLNLELSKLDEEQQIKELRKGLLTVHDDFLLVLDNANDPEEILEFKQLFRGFHWHVLITSRCNGILEAEEELKISHLAPQFARALFMRYYQEKGPDFDEILDRFLSAIGYHTLLIEIFAKHLHEVSEEQITMKDFITRLEEHGLYLEDDRFAIQTRWANTEKLYATNTDKILDVLYDFTALSDQQRQVMVNVALLPVENYSLAFLKELIAPEKDKFRDIVKSLYHKGWLGGGEHFYRISPVVQTLILEKNKKSLSEDAQSLLKNLNEKLSNDGNNFIALSLPEVAPFAKLVSGITQHLEATIPLVILNFSSGLYFERVGALQQAENAFCMMRDLGLRVDIEGYLVMNAFRKTSYIKQLRGKPNNSLESYLGYHNLVDDDYKLNKDNISSKTKLALSYSTLGALYGLVCDFSNCLKNLREKNRLLKEICQEIPGNPEYRENLVWSYSELGKTYFAVSDLENSLQCFQEEIKIAEEINSDYPDELRYKTLLIDSYRNIGDVCFHKQDLAEALNNFNLQHNFTKEIYQENTSIYNKLNLADSFERLGDFYKSRNDRTNAYEHYFQFNKLFKEIYESSPDNIDYINALAISYQKLGDSYSFEDSKQAHPNYQEQRRWAKEAYRRSPDHIQVRRNLLGTYKSYGHTSVLTNKPEVLEASYLEQNKIAREILENDPENIENEINLATSFGDLGEHYSLLGKQKSSLTNNLLWNEAIKKICLIRPEDNALKLQLAVSHAALAKNYDGSDEVNSSLINFLEYNRLTKEICRDDPDNADFRIHLATSHLELAKNYENNDDKPNALTNYIENNRLLKEICTGRAHKKWYDFIQSFSEIGDFYLNNDEMENALRWFEDSHFIINEDYNNDPSNVYNKKQLAGSYEKLGEVYEVMKKLDLSLDNYRQSNNLFREIFNPADNSNWDMYYDRSNLSKTSLNLGQIYEMKGNANNAENCFLESIKLQKEIYELCRSDFFSFGGIRYLSNGYDSLGRLYFKNKTWNDAFPIFEEQLDFFNSIINEKADDLFTTYLYGNAQKMFGYAVMMTQNPAKAAPFFEKSYHIFEQLYTKTQDPGYLEAMKESEFKIWYVKNGFVRLIILPFFRFLTKFGYIRRKIYQDEL